jgi:hypothetical protein
MRTYGGVELYLLAFTISALDGNEYSALRSCTFTLGE